MQIIVFLFPIGIFLFLLYLNLKCLSALLLFRKLQKNNNLTNATVVKWESRSFGYAAPIIIFEDKQNRKIEGIAQNLKTISKNRLGNNYCKVGAKLKVYYSENDPTFFIIDSLIQKLLMGVIFVITGSIILSIVCNFIVSFIK